MCVFLLCVLSGKLKYYCKRVFNLKTPQTIGAYYW